MDTNRCVLQGRLTCDPVLRMTQTGRMEHYFRLRVTTGHFASVEVRR